jgi:hypothetical protein
MTLRVTLRVGVTATPGRGRSAQAPIYVVAVAHSVQSQDLGFVVNP